MGKSDSTKLMPLLDQLLEENVLNYREFQEICERKNFNYEKKRLINLIDEHVENNGKKTKGKNSWVVGISCNMEHLAERITNHLKDSRYKNAAFFASFYSKDTKAVEIVENIYVKRKEKNTSKNEFDGGVGGRKCDDEKTKKYLYVFRIN